MRSGRSVDELATDANPGACLADAAFEDIAYPQLSPNLLHIDSTTLIGKTRIACDDEKAAKARQSGNDFLYHSVRKVLLVMAVTQVIEWQDSDRGLAG